MAIYPLEYLSVLKRKKVVFICVFSAIFFMSLIFALRWDNYKAFATVEVTRPEIAMDVLETGDHGTLSAEAMADLHISRLKQKVLSTASLGEIITKLNLFSEQRRSTPIAYIAETMRKKINLQLLSTSLANPASAQKASALQLSAIAFVLSFEHNDPVMAQKVVNELVTKFLDEDSKQRRDTADKTTEFLDGQIKILSENLEEQEKRIAEFRAENGDIRPDALAFNQQAAATTTSRLLSIESDIISNLGVIGALRAQLAQTEPYARILDEGGEVLTTPAIQLRALKSQYASLTAKYAQNHPDVVRISRQIHALEASQNPVAFGSRLKAQIKDTEAKYNTAKNKYGSDHPDVIGLEKKLSSLQEQLEAAKAVSNNAAVTQDADNPAYLQIVAQLEAAQEQQKALEAQKEQVEKQEEEYRNAVAENPAAEQQMAAMARDYDNLMALYRDLRAKKLAAEMNQTIEQGSIGQRLSVIEAPQVPLGTSPSRLIFVIAGFFVGIAAASGCVLVLQILSERVMGPHHLESIIGVSPLVTIPHLRTLDEKIAIRRRILKMLNWLPILVTILLVIFFATVMPFDVFWATATRKLGF